VGRFFTAVGSSVGFKMAFTYIGDLYKKEEAASKVAYLILSYAITPSLAIVLGGFLTTYFGWYSCFIAQGLFTLVIALISLKLPEDSFFEKNEKTSFLKTLSLYSKEFFNIPFLKSCFLMGCDTAAIYVFASLSPFIFMSEFGLSAKNFGLLNFILPLGMIIGFFLTQALEKKMAILNQVRLGIKISSYFFIILFISLIVGIPRPLMIFIPMTGILSGLCLIYTNASILAMHTSFHKSNGSAIANFLDVSFPAILLFLGQWIPYSPQKFCLFYFQ
jgi:DHA1 family bicyclomycin/chloramphenicol resistance-like MFS transporter